MYVFQRNYIKKCFSILAESFVRYPSNLNSNWKVKRMYAHHPKLLYIKKDKMLLFARQ